MTVQEDVKDRSGGQCEALVLVKYGVWTRCGQAPIEVHHVLTRGRGGALLDAVGETYHLMALCKPHHRSADGDEAYEGDLLIDGYVVTEHGHPVYYGTDSFLLSRYGKELCGTGFCMSSE